LLDEILHELDLLKDKLVVNPYPPYAYRNWDPDLEERYIQERMDVANMLIARKAIKSARVVAKDEDDMIVATADREPVILVRDLLTKRIYGTTNDAKSTNSPTARTNRKWFETFRDEFLKAAGTTAGKAMMTGIGLLLLFLLYRLIR
jgi:hypothetical protein